MFFFFNLVFFWGGSAQLKGFISGEKCENVVVLCYILICLDVLILLYYVQFLWTLISKQI